jgi:hypothetical protein
MSITIDVNHEVEEKLQAQAIERGVPMKELVESLVVEAAQRAAGMRNHRPSVDEFEADMNALADGLDHIPPLHPDAFSREAMYSEGE